MDTTGPLPLLIVFGLDYTLWPYHASNIVAPLRETREGYIDSNDEKVITYPEVPAVFKKIKEKGIKIGVGTTGIKAYVSRNLLHVLNLEKYIDYKEFVWCNYTEVVQSLRKESQVNYTDMLFFDDMIYNVQDMMKLGITGINTPDGMDLSLLETGFQKFRDDKLHPKKKRRKSKKRRGGHWMEEENEDTEDSNETTTSGDNEDEETRKRK